MTAFDVDPEAVPPAARPRWIAAVAAALALEDRADRVARRALRALALDDARARRTVAQGVIGTSAHRLRLAWRLALDGDAALAGHAPALLAGWLVDVAGIDATRAARAFALDDDSAARVAQLALRAWPKDPAERVRVTRSIPRPLFDALRVRYALDEVDAIFAALNAPGPLTLRVNLARTTRDELARALLARGVATRPGALDPRALIVETRFDVDTCALARARHYEVQDEGSQLISAAAAVRPGDVVLDRCAGRGGKTLALLDAMRGDGALVATDVDAGALATLRGRARGLGAIAAPLAVVDPVAIPARRFDVVLVDAPCSSSGALRRGPDMRYRVDADGLAALAKTQRALLVDALARVRPGGRVVYATCSLVPAENEAVIARIVDETGARVVPLAGSPGLAGDGTVTLRPDVHGTDGFFIAALTPRA